METRNKWWYSWHSSASQIFDPSWTRSTQTGKIYHGNAVITSTRNKPIWRSKLARKHGIVDRLRLWIISEASDKVRLLTITDINECGLAGSCLHVNQRQRCWVPLSRDGPRLPPESFIWFKILWPSNVTNLQICFFEGVWTSTCWHAKEEEKCRRALPARCSKTCSNWWRSQQHSL